jgi:ubiquinone/menaquinone biosynthesis C-methylase UbiE
MLPQSNETRAKMDVYAGWDDAYTAGAEGKPIAGGKDFWGEKPPAFLDGFRASIPPGSRVLELCAGDGRITRELVGWGLKVVALDIAPSALDSLQRNFEQRGEPCPLTVRGSVTDIPLGTAQFDAIVCINGIGQIDRPQAAIQEVARLLRPGGRFLLDVFTPKDGTFGVGEQIGAQDFLYKATLFRFFEAGQFEPIFRDYFRVVEQTEATWEDPPHGEFRPVPHRHHALVYVLEKK